MADRFADFNPRAPCGARRNLSAIGGGGQGFQSTRPVWGATLRLPVPRLPCRFQSTRPRGARPLPPLNLAHQHRPFQSTRPRGARLSFPNARCLSLQFQSTRPRGARLDTANIIGDIVRFQSTRPRGARRRNRLGMATVSLFQSTRPRGAQISTRIKTCEIRGAACRMRCGFGQECLTRRFYGLVYPERRNTLCSCRWI